MTKRVLLLVSTLFVLSACADVTSSALVVNDRSFDRGEINDLLRQVDDEIDASEVLALQLGTADGVAVTDLAHPVLNLLIQNEVLRQDLVARGLDVSEEEVEAARVTVQPTGSETVDDLLIELQARLLAYQQIGEDPTQLFFDLEVDIDGRYGRWDPAQAAVVANQRPRVEGSSPAGPALPAS